MKPKFAHSKNCWAISLIQFLCETPHWAGILTTKNWIMGLVCKGFFCVCIETITLNLKGIPSAIQFPRFGLLVPTSNC